MLSTYNLGFDRSGALVVGLTPEEVRGCGAQSIYKAAFDVLRVSRNDEGRAARFLLMERARRVYGMNNAN